MRSPRVVIAGAGMSGLLTGIKLAEAGFRDFTIYEKESRLGGTWRDNRYPGLSCDIPSRYYSYSFAHNPRWSRLFSPQPEILSYLEEMADRYGLRPHIRLGTRVASARFGDNGRWHVALDGGGSDECDFLVSACGILHHPKLPPIEGRDSFAGPAFHTARWPDGLTLAGKRVGLVGNGSTGVQIVSAVAKEVRALTLFQRTPQWVLPLPNLRYRRLGSVVGDSRALSRLAYLYYRTMYEKVLTKGMVEPGWQRRMMSWVCRQHLRLVRDRDLRRRLTPSYQPMCKRLIVSGGFYLAMNRPNVDLVTDSIERIEPEGVRTRDGRLHELDVLVFATGFDAHAFLRPMELEGEDGLTLEQAWAKDPRAYQTVALPGFPNLFLLVGPHSPYGNQSVITIAETQVDYALQWIRMWARGEIERMAPTQEAMERFNADVHAALPNTIWTTGCDSWYLDSEGRPELWPWIPARHRELLREPKLDDFEIARAGS